MRARRLKGLAALAGIGLLAGAVPVAINLADAAGPNTCSNGYTVDEALDNGASWQMCWERRNREGIVLHHVTYTPPGGAPVEILGQMNLAEIHVPYDGGSPRFFDLSGIGLGYDGTMLDLAAEDCPGGSLLQDDGTNVICQSVVPNGYAYKSGPSSGQSTSLRLFSVSELGAYNYVVAWNFDDDGTIRPQVDSAGSLQNYGGSPQTTWPLGGGRRGVAHMHNFYWRLDFDVDGPANDRVEELEALPADSRYALRNTRRAFGTEVARRVAPSGFRSWRVRDLTSTNADGHPLSVELLPDTDHVYRGPTTGDAPEPFTQNEVYVTRFKPCEDVAANNPGATCGEDLSEFANGESLSGRDVVLWYGTSFHHLPRDEDEPLMHPHTSGFAIVPRDLTAENPTVP